MATRSIYYFNTNVPGSGIFVPITKAVRRDSPNHGAYPTTPGPNLRVPGQSTGYTPPTPALPKLSASVGPGARAPSPQSKQRPPRMSLPRPESPVRRTQMTPAPRPSMPSPSKAARQASPTNRFAQSVRGTAGDPNKKIGRLDQSLNLGQRSNSAMGGGAVMNFDDDPAPLGQRNARQPGLTTSASAFNLRRPVSRANNANEEEIERLRAQLEDRDNQLKDQASTLAEMESSLVELQSLIDQSEGYKHSRNSMDDKDSAQLRLMLREKTDKIAMLTAEFDAHRADFRSTIDTLELASTETERVYEKRMEELMADIRELESRNLDVDSVANQLKQLEELVQELEEGLEDARRGEVEARGEAEFLRGEVERTRSELRRERDKSGSPNGQTNGSSDSVLAKELEQKEDEIRGLKAIIHSLSRDSVPGEDEHTPTLRDTFKEHGATNGADRDPLERRVAELQALLDKKNNREEELEREVEHLRRGGPGAEHTLNGLQNHGSSLRDSRDTVIPVRAEPRSPEAATHRRGNTLDTMPESDTYSSETSALWCEICETSGHDILTCTNMFGEGAKSVSNAGSGRAGDRDTLKAPVPSQYANGDDDAARPAPLRSKASSQAMAPIKVMPNPMESGPVPGKESGVMDPEKWCAVCERDGHDSVDCPFEDAF
ncbi:hypothetical protein PWT90_01694 [Aphanocladium album]|nr:hypothetical protein PWT90_01694 [Aphanocladium album]